jgi:hypothetical protein
VSSTRQKLARNSPIFRGPLQPRAPWSSPSDTEGRLWELAPPKGSHFLGQATGAPIPTGCQSTIAVLGAPSSTVAIQRRSAWARAASVGSSVPVAAKLWAQQIHDARRVVLDAAYASTPERFVRHPPRPPALPTAAWINKPASEERAAH